MGHNAPGPTMRRRVPERREGQFFAALWRADKALAGAWWTALLLRGALRATGGRRAEANQGPVRAAWSRCVRFGRMGAEDRS